MQTESPLSLAFEQSERELGQSIGYPALVYHQKAAPQPRYFFEPSRDGGADIMDEDRPLRDTDIVDRLNEQDDDLTRARADIQTLRLALAAAHEHVGALVTQEAGILECLEAGDPWPKSSRDSAAEHLRAAHDAARAWLRRGAK